MLITSALKSARFVQHSELRITCCFSEDSSNLCNSTPTWFPSLTCSCGACSCCVKSRSEASKTQQHTKRVLTRTLYGQKTRNGPLLGPLFSVAMGSWESMGAQVRNMGFRKRVLFVGVGILLESKKKHENFEKHENQLKKTHWIDTKCMLIGELTIFTLCFHHFRHVQKRRAPGPTFGR